MQHAPSELVLNAGCMLPVVTAEANIHRGLSHPVQHLAQLHFFLPKAW